MIYFTCFLGNQNMPPGMPPVSGPPMPYLPTSEHSMGPPPHVGGPPVSSMAGPPNMPMNQNMPPRFPPGGPPGGPGGIPGMLPPGMQQPPPGVNQPPGFPDGMPQDGSGELWSCPSPLGSMVEFSSLQCICELAMP